MKFIEGGTYQHVHNKDVAFHVVGLNENLDSYCLYGYWYNVLSKKLHNPKDVLVITKDESRSWREYDDK